MSIYQYQCAERGHSCCQSCCQSSCQGYGHSMDLSQKVSGVLNIEYPKCNEASFTKQTTIAVVSVSQ